MKPVILFIYIPFIIIYSNRLHAQEVVRGKILSETTSMPIGGATIYVGGQSKAISREDGSFSFTTTTFPVTIDVVHIAYLSVSQSVSSNKIELLIRLIPKRQDLEEVVINTGYEQISKERRTGSFENISAKALNKQVGTDIISRLEGMSTIMFDTHPNRAQMMIRGASTIQGEKLPLIVVDNFPYEGDVSNLNPNDIENVVLLKDAAASSIWGTRAGNGVIVITTKKSKAGMPLRVEFDANVTLQAPPNLGYFKLISGPDLIDLERYLFENDYYTNIENAVSKTYLSPVIEKLISHRDGLTSESELNNWIDELRAIDHREQYEEEVYGQSVNQQYAVNLRGSAKNVSYLFSGGYDRNLDNLANRFNRLTLRTNSVFEISDAFTIDVGLALTNTTDESGKSGYSPTSGIRPYINLYDEFGEATPLPRYRAGYLDTVGNGKLLDWYDYPFDDYRYNKTNGQKQHLRGNLSLGYRITEALGARLIYQYEHQRTDQTTDHLEDGYYARDLINRYTEINPQTDALIYNVPKGGIRDISDQKLDIHNIRGQLNYGKRWFDHQVNVLAGVELRLARRLSYENRTYGFDRNVLTTSPVNYTTRFPSIIDGRTGLIPYGENLGDMQNVFLSQYINGSYVYDDRYAFSASLRRDASNRFGVDVNEKWQPLWSIGGSWHLSNEPFYGGPAGSELKLKATYGVSGMVDQSKSALTTVQYRGAATHTNYPYGLIYQYPNPQLRWEKSAMLNFSVEFRSKGNRISGEISYYRKKGTDLFGPAPVDPSAGIGNTVIRNVANMKGAGVDVRVAARWLDSPFQWQTNFLYAYNDTEITAYYSTATNSSRYISDGSSISPKIGLPVYSISSYAWGGLSAKGQPMGIIDRVPSTDYLAIQNLHYDNLIYNGTALPRMTGAIGNTFSFRGLELDVNITYKLGYYFMNNAVYYPGLFSMVTAQGSAAFDQRWRKPGDELITHVPALSYPVNFNAHEVYRNAEVHVQKGDHIRLQFVRLAYTLSKGKSYLRNTQLYLNASNLGILWRSNDVGLDPDFIANSIPPSPRYAVGCKITF